LLRNFINPERLNYIGCHINIFLEIPVFGVGGLVQKGISLIVYVLNLFVFFGFDKDVIYC